MAEPASGQLYFSNYPESDERRLSAQRRRSDPSATTAAHAPFRPLTEAACSSWLECVRAKGSPLRPERGQDPISQCDSRVDAA
jgi:hypothetical protein